MESSDISVNKVPAPDAREWRAIVLDHQRPSAWRASWQLVNTLGPLVLIGCLLKVTLSVSWWLTVPLAILAGLFLVRIFIIFHDCGHGSFFASRRANDVVGFITGMLTLTPFYQWRWEHAIHHASSGHLDKRGTGDLWTMTVQEYLEASRARRFAYRLARNPFVLFVLAPLFLLIIKQRFPSAKAKKRERLSVYWMNLAILGMTFGLAAIYGLGAYLLIHLIAIATAGSAGFWLFYVQHQFEDAYWEHGDNWDYTAAALKGSSFYRLPKILQWFTGNIGYHHIHHLSARIPNYNLERCHRAHQMFQQVKPITFFASFKTLMYRLWDEREKKLVGYRRLRELRKRPNASPSFSCGGGQARTKRLRSSEPGKRL